MIEFFALIGLLFTLKIFVDWAEEYNPIMCDLICEYCGDEYHGYIKQAITDGWQHGYDASFCPDHNV